jgi:hypothetical protein
MQRRRFKQSQSLEERLAEHAKTLRAEAKLLPDCAARDELFRRAQKRPSRLPSSLCRLASNFGNDARSSSPLPLESEYALQIMKCSSCPALSARSPIRG